MSLCLPISRARTLLGTIVSLRISACSAPEDARTAIKAAFARIERIHALMSFHLPESDISRLNRAAHGQAVEVDQDTYAVLALALDLYIASNGIFDVSVAGELVRRGALPKPRSAPLPDPCASALDIELLDENRVRFRRSLWIDLGGIAKGYAVDCAAELLSNRGVTQGVVNAGGDLRVIGDALESIALTPRFLQMRSAMIELASGSLASSESARGNHLDPRSHGDATPRFVSVAAESCALADALTKPVLARGRESEALLRRYRARAFVFERGSVTTLGSA